MFGRVEAAEAYFRQRARAVLAPVPPEPAVEPAEVLTPNAGRVEPAGRPTPNATQVEPAGRAVPMVSLVEQAARRTPNATQVEPAGRPVPMVSQVEQAGCPVRPDGRPAGPAADTGGDPAPPPGRHDAERSEPARAPRNIEQSNGARRSTRSADATENRQQRAIAPTRHPHRQCAARQPEPARSMYCRSATAIRAGPKWLQRRPFPARNEKRATNIRPHR
ncbi:hypothetical protein [Dactylosporangium sp. NPDC049140]|uniref:hypothetical protein n=1 Tax=Dactylosporangium sp. NPDC049140 TaxID=3155647 RepID=UPI0033CEA150